MSSRVYKGEIQEHNGKPQVSVYADNLLENFYTGPLTHKMLHSPDGFNWGYGGSGPEDLSRSLLWDVLAEEPDSFMCHDFTLAVVAKLPSDWELQESIIHAWVEEWNENNERANS